MIGVPRVARRAEPARFGGRQNAQLGCVGLAADHETGRHVAARQLLGLGRVVVAGEGQPFAQRRAGQLRPEVLQQEGDAAEGSVGQGRGGLAPGPVEELVDDRVQLRIQLLDTSDRPLDQFGRGDLLGPDQLGLCGGVEEGVVAAAHADERY